jgi:hypothetical protein
MDVLIHFSQLALADIAIPQIFFGHTLICVTFDSAADIATLRCGAIAESKSVTESASLRLGIVCLFNPMFSARVQR